MSPELLKAVADSNQWWAIGPELILACAALGLLVMEIILPKDQHRFIPHYAILAQVMVLATLFINFNSSWAGQQLFGGLILVTLPTAP